MSSPSFLSFPLSATGSPREVSHVPVSAVPLEIAMLKKRTPGALVLPLTLLSALLLSLFGSDLRAQSSAAEAYSLARKKVSNLKGLKGEERRQGQEEALEAFALVVQKFPEAREEVARARFEMAQIERRLGRGQAAAKTLADIEASAGPARIRAKALDLAARIAKSEKRYDEAEGHWRTLIDRHPGETRLAGEARLSLAKLFRKQKAWGKARAELEVLLEDSKTGWRRAVDAADALVGLYVARRDWMAAIEKLGAMDAMLRQRFGSDETSGALENAMRKMSSRKALTAVPEKD
jgi:tetratricopeptide (TPR) repeat protein